MPPRIRPKPGWRGSAARGIVVRPDGRHYVEAQILEYIGENHKARVRVLCLYCKNEQLVYVRAWAANGTRCAGCRRFLEQRDKPVGGQ